MRRAVIRMSEKLLAKRGKITKIALIAMAAVLLLSVIGYVSAKYVQQVSATGSVKVSATLAKNIMVLEHEAVRQSDGSYKLGTSEVKANEYKLMPGVDVPKDPTVRVTGYTGMPAYVFISVDDSGLPSTVEYSIAAGWTKLTDTLWYREVNGETSGTPETTVANETTALTGTETLEFPILTKLVDECELKVSQNLPRGTSASLTFRAYIVQKTGDKTAAQVAQDSGLMAVETTANP